MSDLVDQIFADPAVTAVGMAVGIALIALWVAAAWWAYTDATRRTEHSLAGYIAAGWVLLSTPLLLPLSLAVYAFARPQLPAGDRRVNTLARELMATASDQRCRSCGVPVDEAWLRCPTCATWLASPCTGCGRWSDDALELCPWCGREAREIPSVREIRSVDDHAPAMIPVAAAAGPVEAMEPDAPERRARLPWRAASPGVSRSQRGDNRRLAIAPDGRRLSRARIRA